MKTRWVYLALASALALVGCGAPGGTRRIRPARAEPVFLTVDFQEGQTLRYRFVSSRNIVLDWDPGAAASRNRMQEQSERLELVVVYTPLEVDPFGASTLRATVESADVTRSGGPGSRRFGPDAVETARGRSFALKVDPRGRIVDAAELDGLIGQMGKSAFRSEASRGRVKEPDMIGDFIALQWFLWDSVGSIAGPADGVVVGQTWHSQLSVPTPMVMRRARDVTYRLDELRRNDGGTTAIITSTYALAASVPTHWPVPYSGRFQMSGTFGFLGPYEVLGLEGAGTELFEVEAGRVARRSQEYALRVRASLPPMGIKANPHITIEQTLTMDLMDPE